MSGFWISTVYFPPIQQCAYEFLATVVRQLGDAGLVLQIRSDTGQGQWWSPSGENIGIATIEEGIALTTQYGKGGMNVGELETGMADYASFSLYADELEPNTSDPFTYGQISLLFNEGNLQHEIQSVVRRRYELLFQWSNVLARATNAIYGWGDLQGSSSTPDIAVLASDLQQGKLPRFSWWNFFSKAYLNQLGKHRLSTAGAWLTHEDESGWTVILQPPSQPAFATEKDWKMLGLR